MPTTVGKKLRSRKVKLACERRQIELADSINQLRGNNTTSQNSWGGGTAPKVIVTNDKSLSEGRGVEGGSHLQPSQPLVHSSKRSTHKEEHHKEENEPDSVTQRPSSYDTVTSVHDIGQDDHIYYGKEPPERDLQDQTLPPGHHPLLTFERKLAKIVEVPSKNITRNNSASDVNNSCV
jgi:hypothetical protein